MENTLIAIAAWLERVARALGHGAGAISGGRAARIARSRAAPSAHPAGQWRCVHADEFCGRHFKPGEIYRADLEPDTSTIRIRHGKGGCWAPYWNDDARRFCYPADKLDFEYVGAA